MLQYFHMQLIFLDTETTGNEVSKDRLVQLAYKTPSETVVEYFKPPLPISTKSMSITHITNEMVADKPIFKDSPAALKIQNYLNDGVMIAHNALFDKAILEAEGISVPHFIDTLRIARYLDTDNAIPEYNLQFLRYHLKLEIPDLKGLQAHDAESDITVLEALFKRLYAKMFEEIKDEEKTIEKLLDISSHPLLLKVIPFGKHKGETLEEVVATDKAYLRWLLNQKNQEATQNGTDPNQDDWIYTLNHYLS